MADVEDDFPCTPLRDLTPFPWTGLFWVGSDQTMPAIDAAYVILNAEYAVDNLIFWGSWAYDGSNYYEFSIICKEQSKLVEMYEKIKALFPGNGVYQRAYDCYQGTPPNYRPFI
jgi:hypothetical protein